MSLHERQKWDGKYAGMASVSLPPAPQWLIDHLEKLPRGKALDLATGLGGAAVELSKRGWKTTAVDISPVGIRLAAQLAKQEGTRIAWIVADLDEFSLPPRHFDVITAFYFLERRRLAAQITGSLRPGGMLVYETYTSVQSGFPSRPKNPDHVLRPGELFALFRSLRVLAYREVLQSDHAFASLLAQKP